jgi:hypothetical protein
MSSKLTFKSGQGCLAFCLLVWSASTINAQTRQTNRTIDGTYNNLTQPNWGKAGIPLYRELPAEYGASDPKNAMGGANRPSPRAISNKLSDEPEDIRNERDLSGLTYIWGQFIDHDMTLSPTGATESVPIPLPSDESKFTNPIPFKRSVIHPNTGVQVRREQTNVQTSWLDGSQVYGADAVTANWLRTFQAGKLKVSAGNQLPFNTNTGEYSGNLDPNAPKMDDDNGRTKKTFVAGDPRAAEHPGLTSLHTVFVREHNRICDRLISQGVTQDEAIYQKARKEIGALIQAVTYGQWLEALGIQLQSYVNYNPSAQPDIRNTFATAAYRWHTMVENDIILRDNECHGVGRVEIPLKDVFFNIEIVRKNDIGVLLKGLSVHRQYETDLKVNNGLRNFLFGSGSGLDLVSLNLQRGRDHGLPNYNSIREFYVGSKVSSFIEISQDASIASKMQTLYGSVDNIDLWAGLFAEKRLAGKSVGRTVDAMIRAQFEKLRDGDFYYFMNDPALSADKYRIQSTTLGDLLARNSTAGNFQSNVFIRKHCSSSGDDIAHYSCSVTPTFEGWTFLGKTGNNTYYRWESTVPSNYAEAKQLVTSLGGHLPQMKHSVQNAFLSSRLGSRTIWLDLVRAGSGWQYSNGAIPPYYRWATGEPNNASGAENYTQMYSTGLWNDVPATAYGWVVAEVPCEEACDQDVTPPVFTYCPPSQNVQMGLLTLCKSVSWAAPTVEDNCGNVALTMATGFPSGTCFWPGSYTITYAATDARFNRSTCSFNVTAYKTLFPLLTFKKQVAIHVSATSNLSIIEWANNSGAENTHFEVEKLNVNTGQFELLEKVANRATDNSTTQYITTERTPAEGAYTYRIKAVHQDGSVTLSEAKKVFSHLGSTVQVYPNPAMDLLTVDLEDYKNETVEITLYDYLGQQKMMRSFESLEQTKVELDVMEQPAGNYRIRVHAKGKQDVTKSVIIVR